MNEIITIVAQYFIVLPVIAGAIIFMRLKSKENKTKFAIAMIAGGLLTLFCAYIASKLYSDPRPFVVAHFTPLIPHAAGNGFPSDHTLLAAFIGWTILLYSRKYGVIVLVIALLIGIARVLAGVHHVSDIIGSFVISGLVVILMHVILRRIKITQKR